MKRTAYPTTAKAIARAIGEANPSANPSTRPVPKVLTSTRDQLDNQDTGPVPWNAPGVMRDRTVAHAGIRTPDRANFSPFPHPGPTGGPVGRYGTHGPIGPWGSWK